LIAWSVRYGMCVWFAESHARAAAITQRALEGFAVDHLRQSQARGVSV